MTWVDAATLEGHGSATDQGDQGSYDSDAESVHAGTDAGTETALVWLSKICLTISSDGPIARRTAQRP